MPLKNVSRVRAREGLQFEPRPLPATAVALEGAELTPILQSGSDLP